MTTFTINNKEYTHKELNLMWDFFTQDQWDRIISNIDTFFDIENWDFGETFYFTELSAYIHSQLVGNIQSVVLVPQYENSRFGNLFQITPNENELFVSSAKVADVQVVSEFNNTNLRIDQA